MAGEVLAGLCEGFHQTWAVVLRPTIARVQQEGVVDLVALEDTRALQLFALGTGGACVGRPRGAEELRIRSVVGQADALLRDAQGFAYVTAGSFGDGDDTFGAQQ